jgi:hypothetical protein
MEDFYYRFAHLLFVFGRAQKKYQVPPHKIDATPYPVYSYQKYPSGFARKANKIAGGISDRPMIFFVSFW